MAALAENMTKSSMNRDIATKTGLSRTQVDGVLDAMNSIIESELKAGRSVTLSGLVRLSVARKDAAAAYTFTSPSTGKKYPIAAKQAHNVVKAKKLKKLDDMMLR